MSALREASPIPLEIPLQGMDLNQRLLKMSPASSPWLLNVECENDKIKVRPGVQRHAAFSSSTVMALGVYGDAADSANYKLFAYISDGTTTHKIYDASTTSPSLVETCTATSSATKVQAHNFMTKLYFATEDDSPDCARYWDGSTWTAWGYTFGGSPVNGFVATNYRGRTYVPDQSSIYWAATVGGVTGAMNQTSLTSVKTFVSKFCFAAVVSGISASVLDVYFVVGSIAGEILVYSGDYPDSSTWSLVQRFKVSSPGGYMSYLEVDGDIWVFTQSGAISVRALMSGSMDPQVISPSYPINAYWTKLANVSAGNLFSRYRAFKGVYWRERNRIYIVASGHVDEAGAGGTSAATILSYNTLTKAWSVWSLGTISATSITDPVIYNGAVYFATGGTIMKVVEGSYKDEAYNSASSYSAYSWAVDGAYADLGSSQGKHVQAFQPLVKTDFVNGTTFGVKAVADVGRASSSLTYPSLLDGYNMPYCSVGVDGQFVKYRLQGSSDTTSADGLELYGLNAVMGGQGVR